MWLSVWLNHVGCLLTCQGLRFVIFVELPHAASEFSQAIARLHRQSQRNAVTAYVLIGSVSGGAASEPSADQTIANVMLADCARGDRKHWLRLNRMQAEAVQVLGDPSPHEAHAECKALMVPTIQEKPLVLASCEADSWLFVVIGETSRLHVYDAKSMHIGLISRTPVDSGEVHQGPVCKWQKLE